MAKWSCPTAIYSEILKGDSHLRQTKWLLQSSCFLSLYNLISCSSEQLKRINLYKNNFISLAKHFPVPRVYSNTNLLNIRLCWPLLEWERTLGSQRNPAYKLSVHCHTARKSVLSTCLLVLLKEDDRWRHELGSMAGFIWLAQLWVFFFIQHH